MPNVVNGIGTWYWGKRNIRVRRDVCAMCSRPADLRSYDTTLYFVFLFVPVLPLRRVHVRNECSKCKQHQVVKRKEWERTRQRVLGEALAACRDHPRDPERVREAISAAVAFEDEPALAEVASIASETLAGNASVQDWLAEAYALFGHADLAELAYRTSLSLVEDPEVALRLGENLLRTGRAAMGWEVIRPLITPDQPERAGAAYLAATAFQAEGDHARALEVLDHCVGVLPDLADDKGQLELRKKSSKHLASGKRIPSALIRGDGSVRTKEGGLLSRLPAMIPLVLVVLLIAGFSAISLSKAGHRRVYLVSGLDDESRVTIDGRGYQLGPHHVQEITLPEGTHSVSVTVWGTSTPPELFSFRSSFLGRPFDRRVFVVNADRLALLKWEQAVYTTSPSPGASPGHSWRLFAAQAFYVFDGLDYAFRGFPASVPTGQRAGRTTKERIDTLTGLGVLDTCRVISSELGAPAAEAWIIRAGALRPGHPDVYEILIKTMPPERVLEVVRPLLAVRPVLVEAHRAYQAVTEWTDPGHDLTAEYAALLDAAPDDAGAKYLLGRVTRDVTTSEALLVEAGTSPQPVWRALAGLAYNRMSQGRFKEAGELLESAQRMGSIEDTGIARLREEILKASGDWKAMLELDRYKTAARDTPTVDALMRCELFAAMGDRPAAQAWVEEYEATVRAELGEARGVTWRRCADAMAAYVAGIPEGLAALCTGPEPVGREELGAIGMDGLWFLSALTGGRMEEVAAELNAEGAESEPIARMLFAIALSIAGERERAGEQFGLAGAGLSRGDWEDRRASEWMTGERAPAPGEAEALLLLVDRKAVVLTVLGILHPAIRESAFALARRLNYDRSCPHLLLEAAYDQEDWPDR